MRIQQNTMAFNAYRLNNTNISNTAKNITKLSSGYMINTAADDAAGLAISEKMRAQIHGLERAARNVQDGISIIQTVDGALANINNIVTRMRELAVQAASDTNQNIIDREALDLEYQQMKNEIDNIVSKTSFNGTYPLIGHDMESTQNTVRSGAVLTAAVIDVDIVDYSGSNPSVGAPPQLSISDVAALSGDVETIGTVSSVNVSGSVSAVGAVADLTGVTVNISGVSTYPPPVVGNSITLNTGDAFIIDATDIAGVTDITVADGAKLIINGDISGDINISGGGEVGIIGNAAGVTVGSGSKVQITGDATGAITNSGSLTIDGHAAGTVINSGVMTIGGDAGNVVNDGSIMISGSVMSLDNIAGANAELKNAAGASITNAGRMEIAGATSGTNIQNANNAVILVSGGSGVTITDNSGTIEVSGAGITIAGNNGAMLVSGSDAIITGNSGTMEVSGTKAHIADNHGNILVSGSSATIANNHDKILVTGNDATISDNDAQIEVSGLKATINDNQKDILVSGNDATITDNNGHIEVGGRNATIKNNQKDILVTGEYATIKNNSGDILVTGSSTTVDDNSANILVTSSSATINDNNGHIEARGQNTTVTNNHSNILLSGLYAVIDGNSGHIEAEGANVTINDNYAQGRILAFGDDAIVNDNHGDLVISGSAARVVLNSGKLYSAVVLEVVENAGEALLEANGVIVGSNSGDMCINGSDAQINYNYGKLEVKNGDNTRIIANYGTGELTITGDNVIITGGNTGKAYIDGDNAVVSSNSGELKIDGESATVTNLASGQLLINGDDAVLSNSGSAHVKGDRLELINNSNGSAKIDGDNLIITGNETDGRIDVNGADCTVNSNSGSIEINGNNSVIQENSGNIRLENAGNAQVADSRGRIEVGAGSEITRLADNNGTILVEDGGKISDASGINNGRIDVSAAAEITILLNNDSIISRGTSTINTNAGYLEVGEWIDDDATHADGSATGAATVTTNEGGVICNYSRKLNVAKNISGILQMSGISCCYCVAEEDEHSIGGGLIENYGTMNDTCVNEAGANMQGLSAEINHHVRQVVVSGITANGGGMITYTANGQSQTTDGVWKSLTGSKTGHELAFDVTPLDKGTIIFDASSKYEVPGTEYAIQERVSVNGSTGSSGGQLLYRVLTPFLIQSGANQDDEMILDFIAVDTKSLATLIDSCGCMCNLNMTHLELQQSATYAIENCDQAINDISSYRAKLGAAQNRLEHKLSDLETSAENLTASESRIRDADIAKEVTEFSKNQILVQSSNAMLSQAYLQPQLVLHLLR